MPVAVVSIYGTVAGCFIVGASFASSGLNQSIFTGIRNDTGQYTVSWSANAFPTPICPPVVSVNLSSTAQQIVAQCAYQSSFHAFDVQLYDVLIGAYADGPCVVLLF